MTNQEWLALYDKTSPMFKWFIEKYFKGYAEKLAQYRIHRKWSDMLNLMNDMWFRLPDNRFNIIENPEGWGEFVTLLENPPQEDGEVNIGGIG